MKKSFKYRLKPSTEQREKLEQTLALCCDLYNAALQERSDAYKSPNKKGISSIDQLNELPEIKKTFPEYQTIHAQVLQDVLRRLDKTFQAFFFRCKTGEKPGYPRYRCKARYDSFSFPQSGFSIREKTITLSKIGEIKTIFHRKLEGKIKTCTIKREANEWYVVFSCDLVPEKYLPKTGAEIGIDVGLEYFATLSNGEHIENPLYAKRTKAKLRRTQRKLARCKRGSNRRKKQVVRVAKQHLKVKRQRRDFHFKLAGELLKRFDVIHFERLNIRNMVRNRRLAFSISDAAWYQFQEITAFKAAEAGKLATKNNARNSSNECNVSGEIKKKSLSQRFHVLPNGEKIHRDHNAAINILRRGQRHQSVTQGL